MYKHLLRTGDLNEGDNFGFKPLNVFYPFIYGGFSCILIQLSNPYIFVHFCILKISLQWIVHS